MARRTKLDKARHEALRERVGAQYGNVRVIIDPRNASWDRFIPRADAERLLREGKLAWDATNGTYTMP